MLIPFIVLAWIDLTLAQGTPGQWRATLYQGINCSGAHVGELEHVGYDFECDDIATPSYVSAVSFEADDSTTDTWSLGLHNDLECADETAGSFEVSAGIPAICIPIEDATFISVKKIALARRTTSLKTSESTALVVRAPTDLTPRQEIFTPAWIMGITAGVGAFSIAAFETCPNVATPDSSQAASCAISICGDLIFLAASTWQYRRALARANADASPARLLTLPDLSQIGRTPVVFEEAADGFTTTFTSVSDRHIRDANYPIAHLFVEVSHASSGQKHAGFLDFNKDTNHTSLRVPSSIASMNKRQDVGGEDFVAYYSYTDFSEDAWSVMARDNQTLYDLGYRLWTFGRENDVGGFCANLALPLGDGLYDPINVGFFSLIPGQFVDRTPNCPREVGFPY